MTPEEAKELLPLITAYAEGKQIQSRSIKGNWQDLSYPAFNLPPKDYRIKPQPIMAKAYLTKRNIERWADEIDWPLIEKQDSFWKWVSEPFEITD